MLKIGDKAPDFKAVDGDGRTVALSDYKGKKLVIITAFRRQGMKYWG